jgi:uncharacterized lipoprotein YddW (UPF0748 family)
MLQSYKIKKYIAIKWLLCCYLLFASFFLFSQSISQNPKREFRGVWIANVMNLDFPTSAKLSTAQQQKEFIAILDQHQKSKINAVIVQIRPSADALYFSAAELWSEWLTGKQGQMPTPFYDPLAFMIEETHKRGMEFHAWLNPYRAVADTAKLKNLHENHITKQKPTWFIDYGKNRIFDPAIPEVREYIANIVADIVRRYDVDGIHFDDYFYPYPIANQEFNDQKSFEKYNKAPNMVFQNKADWRRNNTNLLIEKVSNTIKNIKPYIKFGISPFPVWRNKQQDANGSNTTGGLTSYDHLFADIRLWLSKGWIDYIAPQNYFSHHAEKVPYRTLTEWWTKNTFGKHLYIGHAVYKLNGKEDSKWTDKAEIQQQVNFNRQQNNLHGSIYYSSTYITTNFEGFRDTLQQTLNKHFALVPPMLWKDNIAPNPPKNIEAFIAKNGILLHWQPTYEGQKNGKLSERNTEKPCYYVIYRFREGEVIDIENPAKIVGIHRKEDNFFIDTTLQGSGEYIYTITAVDRLHNESIASSAVKITYKDKGTWADFLLTFIEISKKFKQ